MPMLNHKTARRLKPRCPPRGGKSSDEVCFQKLPEAAEGCFSSISGFGRSDSPTLRPLFLHNLAGFFLCEQRLPGKKRRGVACGKDTQELKPCILQFKGSAVIRHPLTSRRRIKRCKRLISQPSLGGAQIFRTVECRLSSVGRWKRRACSCWLWPLASIR